MKKSAYIRRSEPISLESVKETLEYYREMTRNTGKQLAWDYEAAAFPYTMEEKEQDGTHYLLLTGKDPHQNNHLVLGVGQHEDERYYVQVVLPEDATHHDVAKGNEYSKFLAKQLKGELQLFNGRIMAF